MKVRKLGRRIHLEGASCAGLQRLQDGVVRAEFLYHALAVRPSIHAKDTHGLSSVESLVNAVVAALCRESEHHTFGYFDHAGFAGYYTTNALQPRSTIGLSSLH